MKKKIYTIGKMSGLSLSEQMSWRSEIEHEICKEAVQYGIKIPDIIHPPLYYNYEEQNHKSEAEIAEWELNSLCGSDIAIVNLDGVNSSVGSLIEIGVVNAINMRTDKHIYLLGLGNVNKDAHPWIVNSLFRVEKDSAKLADYIIHYLLL